MEINDKKAKTINLNEGIEYIDINPENLSLYLNMIGGHSFFVEYTKEYLIKSVGEKELKFYEFIFRNKIKCEHMPNFHGVIEKGTKRHEYIINYKKKCDVFFKQMVKYFDIKSEDIIVEKDLSFHKKFNDFMSSQDDINVKLDSSFDKLKQDLINIKNNCEKKLFWIFFWYIKWQKEFISDKYIIIQNLEFTTNFPSIIDIKIGNEKKISKETGQVKKFKGAFESLGCRIMGISSNNTYFKSRYETKDLDETKFIDELKLFFGQNKNIILNVIDELKNIISFLQNSFFQKIYFCSLLIFFDNSDKDKIPIVKLIDLDLTNNLKDMNNINIIKERNSKNEMNTDNKGFISCINNLINILNNL